MDSSGMRMFPLHIYRKYERVWPILDRKKIKITHHVDNKVDLVFTNKDYIFIYAVHISPTLPELWSEEELNGNVGS